MLERISVGERITPMDTEGVQILEMGLGKDCQLKNTYLYYVKKIKDKNGVYHFYATTRLPFDRSHFENWGANVGNTNEIGFSECDSSTLNHVDVDYTARRCGIGGKLSLLCMIDMDVTDGGNGMVIDFTFSDWVVDNKGKKIKDRLKGCKNLFWINNIADPPEGANAYFNSAKMANHNTFISVKGSTDGTIMSVDNAKTEFNQKGANEFKKLYGEYWYFCKMKRRAPTPPPFTCWKMVTTAKL